MAARYLLARADDRMWRLNQYSGERRVAYNLELAALWVAGATCRFYRLERWAGHRSAKGGFEEASYRCGRL